MCLNPITLPFEVKKGFEATYHGDLFGVFLFNLPDLRFFFSVELQKKKSNSGSENQAWETSFFCSLAFSLNFFVVIGTDIYPNGEGSCEFKNFPSSVERNLLYTNIVS